MILFHLQTLGAGRHIPSFFVNFLNNKIVKNIYIFFLMLRFFRLYVFFLLERDRKHKNYECDCPGNPIPYKIMFVSAT